MSLRLNFVTHVEYLEPTDPSRWIIASFEVFVAFERDAEVTGGVLKKTHRSFSSPGAFHLTSDTFGEN